MFKLLTAPNPHLGHLNLFKNLTGWSDDLKQNISY